MFSTSASYGIPPGERGGTWLPSTCRREARCRLFLSRTQEFLASPRLLASHLLWKQKEDSIMARPLHASGKLVLQTFEPLSATCLACGNAAHIAYHTQWTVTTLTGRHHLHLAVRRCTSPECPRNHRPYRLGSQREHGHYHTGNTDWT